MAGSQFRANANRVWPARLVLVVRGFPDLHVRVASVIGPSWAMGSRTAAQRSIVRPLLIQLVATQGITFCKDQLVFARLLTEQADIFD